MTSVVDICNRALSACSGRSAIASLTEDSPAARQCALWYDDVRQIVSRAANWQCNKKYATLALLKAMPGTPENPTASATSVWDSSQPPPPWLYSYAYPNDCMRLRFLMGQYQISSGFSVPLFSTPIGSLYPQQQGYAPFSEGIDDSSGSDVKVVLTNQSQAILTYSKDVTDPNVWDVGFQEAVIYGLSGRICMGVTGDKGMAQQLYKQANDALLRAQASDANEMTTINDHTPDWIAVRSGIPYGDTSYSGWLMAPYGPLFTQVSV